MEEQLVPHPMQSNRASFFPFTNDRGAIVVLLVLAALVHGWLICHTDVTSRDSIGFERYAWELGHQQFGAAARHNAHPPLYPLTVLVTSVLVRHFVEATDLEAMQLGAQLASGLAGALLTIPMYFLGRDLFNSRVGFWAAALFQCLPVGARIISDALSDSLFLLLSASAVLLAGRALRSQSLIGFCACGTVAGLAYLTRPEGILIVLAVGAVLFSLQAIPNRRRPWRLVLCCGGTLTAAALVVGAPYALVIGGLSNKTTVRAIMGSPAADNPSPVAGAPAASLAGWWDGRFGGGDKRLAWAFGVVTGEIVKGFFYVAWLPAVVGLYWFRPNSQTNPAVYVLLLLCLLHSLALLRLALVAGYVSDRHVLIIVMFGLYWSVAAILEARRWPMVGRMKADLVILLVIAAAGVFKTLEPLHANRAGHRAVGVWLARHSGPADEIIDPFCWAAHYAGRTFVSDNAPTFPGTALRNRYVVRVCRPDHRLAFRPPSIPEADLLAAGGRIVYHWPAHGPRERAEILLYEVPFPPPP